MGMYMVVIYPFKIKNLSSANSTEVSLGLLWKKILGKGFCIDFFDFALLLQWLKQFYWNVDLKS